MQDLRTEQEGAEGGFAWRDVRAGSLVVLRGTDDATGAVTTFFGHVTRVYRPARGDDARPKLRLNWLYRPEDLPPAARRRAEAEAPFAPRELLYSSHDDPSEAACVRHPARAWYLGRGDPEPSMRCGEGQARWGGGNGWRWGQEAPRCRCCRVPCCQCLL